MECGKERLKLSDRADVLKSLLEELGDMARTIYEEEAIKKQIELSRKQILLAMLFGVSSDLSSFCCSIDNRFPHILFYGLYSYIGRWLKKKADRW
jgi:hypothetical protein